MREPLPKMTTSASSCGQSREMLGAQVLEALRGPVDALAARSSTMTLCVIFSPLTPTQPGP